MPNAHQKDCAASPDAFMDRVTPHLQSLTALIRFRIPWRDDWDDVLQTTLLCAWRAMPELRDTRALKPWLLKICGNCCHMHMRSTIRRDTHTQRYRETMTRNTAGTHARRVAMGRSPGADAAEMQLEVERMLAQLPESDRRMMVDYYFKGLRVAEIAAREDRPEGTVKRRLHAGRQRLKAFLDREPDTEREGTRHDESY